MQTFLFVAGLVAIYAVLLVGYLRHTRTSAEADLRAFAATVPAPLTDDVRRWLAPQLRRRTVYPFVGAMAGVIVGNSLDDVWSDAWAEPPWYWLALLICLGAGSTLGSLIAGFRTTPLVDGPVRSADASRRRLADVVGHAQVVRLRLAVVISLGAAVLAATVALTSSEATGSASRALLACAIGAALVIADYAVAAVVTSRPLVASTPDGLLWQRALVLKTVENTPTFDLVVATAGAGVALYVTFASYDELPVAVLAIGVGLALLTGVVVGSALLSGWRSREVAGAPREPARP